MNRTLIFIGIMILILIITSFLGVVILYDKQEAYCAKYSQKTLGDQFFDKVTPTQDEIEKLNLQDEIKEENRMSLGYIEFLKCTKNRNILRIIQNKEILKQ